MRSSRRMRRMGRNRKITTGLLLTSLMDIFTILVFFFLVHSSDGVQGEQKEAYESSYQGHQAIRNNGHWP